MSNEFRIKKGLIVNETDFYVSGSKAGFGTITPSSPLEVYGSGSTVFSVNGASGQLFGVSDDLTDSLFSVNTISGLPVIEAFADNTVKIGTYGNEELIVSESQVSILSASIYGPAYLEGNVGIGTTSPAQTLDIENAIELYKYGSDSAVIETKGSMYFNIDRDNSYNGNKFFFGHNGASGSASNLVTIEDTGNVGIGTTSPDVPLHIVGDQRIQGDTASLILVKSDNSTQIGKFYDDAGFTIEGKVNNNLILRTKANTLGEGIKFQDTSSTTLMFIDGTTSNVGIGTASPDVKLHIDSDPGISQGTVLKVENSGDYGSARDIHIYNQYDRDIGIFFETLGGINYIYQDSNGDDSLIFTAGGYIRGTDDTLILYQNHNVEIPNGSLTVSGDLTVGGIVTAEEFHTEFVSASIIYQSGSTKFGDTSDDVHAFTGSLQQSGSDSYFLGDVGIGTTSPDQTLHVFKGSAGSIDSNSNAVITAENSGNGYIQLLVPDANESGILFGRPTANADGGILYNSSTTRGLEFRTAGNSTKMVIDSSGNVGIGTTSPAEKLTVAGNISGSGNLNIEGTATVDGVLNVNSYIYIDRADERMIVMEDSRDSNTGYLTMNDAQGNMQLMLGVDGDGHHVQTGDGAAKLLYTAHGQDGVLSMNAAKEGITGADISFSIGLSVDSNDNTIKVGASNDNVGLDAGGNTVFDASGNLYTENIYARNANGLNILDDGGTLGIFVEDGGNVGIGTTSPSQKLHVADSENPTILIEDTNLDNQARVEFKTATYNWVTGLHGGENAFKISNNSGFGTNDFLTVKDSGNVGIGTVNPGAKLEVAGDSKFQDLLTVANDIYPETNYVSNIGAVNKKFLTLNVAELIVETLVASERRSTVGGRFNVGISTQLSQSISPASSSILVENNNLNPGDIIHLEGGTPAGTPQVEFMRVTSTASSGSGDGFSYTVDRNLDGTGANTWEAGSGVFNTGVTGSAGQSGTGFIDQYAINSLTTGVTTAGPTIAFMERTGSAYPDIDSRAVVGNLKGWYGYGTDIFGFASGDYKAQNITVDPFNGLRIRNVGDIQLQASSSFLSIGDDFLYDSNIGKLFVSGSNIDLVSPSFFLGGTTQYISGSGGSIEISGSNFHLLNGNITASNVDLSGNINAETGTIGGFTISADALSSSDFFLSGSATGNEFFISSSNFNVKANGDVTGSSVLLDGGTVGGFDITSTQINNSSGTDLILKSNGQITASAADISGKITAGSGQIADWTITSDAIFKKVGSVYNIIGRPDDIPGAWDTIWENGFTVGKNNSNRMWFSGDETGNHYEMAIYSASRFIVRLGTNENKIAGWTIDDESIFSGTKDVSGYATSGITLYSSGSIHTPNFYVDTGGNAFFKGTLSAPDGNIGGFTISGDALAGSNFYISGSATGNEFFISSSNFNVKANGDVTGSSVLFTGGKIAGWTVNTDTFSSDGVSLSNATNEKGLLVNDGVLNRFQAGDFLDVIPTGSTASGGTRTEAVSTGTKLDPNPVSPPSFNLSGASTTPDAGSITIPISSTVSQGDTVNVAQTISYKYLLDSGITSVNQYASVEVRLVSGSSTVKTTTYARATGYPSSKVVNLSYYYTGSANLSSGDLKVELIYSSSYERPTETDFFQEVFVSPTNITIDQARVNITDTQALFFQGPERYLEWTPENFTIKGGDASFGDIEVNDAIITGDSIFSGSAIFLGQVTISGSLASHPVISPVASDVNNSGGTVIQDLDFDVFGHVQSVTSYNLDGRYYTETESDSRFVNVTGDTMTGALIVEGSGSTIFDVQGSLGQLFSVTDNLTGTLFSVNDISGIPILTVDSDDTVTMGTFGENTLVVTGSRVGIGTESPSRPLTIEGSVSASGDVQIGSGTGANAYGRLQVNQSSNTDEEGIGILSSGAGRSMRLYVDETNSYISSGDGGNGVLVLNEGTGNVGIGTTSPSSVLHIKNSTPEILLEDSDVANRKGKILANNGNLGLFADSDNVQSDSIIYFNVDSSEKMRIDSSGNVGIGTTSPESGMHIVRNVNNSSVLGSLGTNGTGPEIKIENDNATAGSFSSLFLRSYTGDARIFASTTGVNNAVNFGIRLDNTADTSGITRFYIEGESGNVGIGTTSPSSTLHVNGPDTNDHTPTVFLKNNGANAGEGEVLDVETARGDGASDSYIARFRNSVSTKFYIRGDGLIGIGTESPEGPLHIKKTSASSVIIENTEDAGGDSDLILKNTNDRDVGMKFETGGGFHHLMQDSAGDDSLFVSAGGRDAADITIEFYQNHNVEIPNGSLTVSGDITVGGKVTAEEFHTEFVSASIIYQSGSTKFGDTNDDIHQFTGSIFIKNNTGVGTVLQTWVGESDSLVLENNNSTGDYFLKNTEQDNGILFRDGTGGIEIWYDGVETYKFQSSGAEFEDALTINADLTVDTDTLYVDSTNNTVGIGTTSPPQKLTVAGNISGSGNLDIINTGAQIAIAQFRSTDNYSYINIGGTTDSDSGIIFSEGGSSETAADRRFMLGYDASEDRFRIYQYYKGDGITNVGQERLVVDGDGNVGIGETTPLVPLHISKDSASGENIALLLDNNNTTAGNEIGMLFRSAAGSTNTDFEIFGVANAANDMDLVFQSDGSVERVRFTGDGNVGIGTDSPDYPLTVYNASGAVLKLDSGGTNNSQVRFHEAGTLKGAITYIPATDQIRIYNVSDVVTIGTSNIGIGTTSPPQKLTVEGNISGSGTLNIDGDITGEGNLTIQKTEPTIRLVDTNTATTNFPRIIFDTNNNQGVMLYHDEFDTFLPENGYGLVLGPSPNNTQFPDTGNLTLQVLGSIYADSETTGSGFKVLTTADEGSGNGIDADTVDGLEASQFLRSDANDTTTGFIAAGDDNGTSGAKVLRQRYSGGDGDNVIASIGTMYSSGNWLFGYGIDPKNGSSGYISSFDNFSGKRSAIELGNDYIELHYAPAQATAVGSDITSLSTPFVFDLTNTRMGIGTTNPDVNLHVVNAGSAYIKVERTTAGSEGHITLGATTSDNRIYSNGVDSSTGKDLLLTFGGVDTHAFNSNGNVGIGTTSPGTKLEVNGTATVTSLVETSTRKLKENIETLKDQSSIVDSLQPVSYTWKESKEEDFGLIAEDVAEIASHLVSRDEDGNPSGIKYSKLSVLLLDVVQRQSTLIEDLNKRITKLENERG